MKSKITSRSKHLNLPIVVEVRKFESDFIDSLFIDKFVYAYVRIEGEGKREGGREKCYMELIEKKM